VVKVAKLWRWEWQITDQQVTTRDELVVSHTHAHTQTGTDTVTYHALTTQRRSTDGCQNQHWKSHDSFNQQRRLAMYVLELKHRHLVHRQ